MKALRAGPAVFVAASALIACSDSIVGSRLNPTQLEMVSGSGQTGVSGTPFAKPLIVEVRANDSIAIPGLIIEFRVTAGAAVLADSTVVSDSVGHASMTVTPTGPGNIEVTARVFSSNLIVEFLLSATGTSSSPCIAGASSLFPAQIRPSVGGNGICVAGNATDADYVLVAFNSDTVATANAPIRLTGTGITSPSPQLPFPPGSAVRAATPPLQLPVRTTITSALGIPAKDTIGQRRVFNVNFAQPCNNAQFRTGRVVAISASATIYADSLMPPAAMTAASLAALGAMFDSLVVPAVSENMFTPIDIDVNGRTILFLTPAVNAVAGTGGGPPPDVVFHQGDLLTPNGPPGLSCPTSNRADMLYLSVPDPSGTFGSPRLLADLSAKGWPRGAVNGLQRIVNTSRRLYLRFTPILEAQWLDRGLSQIAEELLFYRMASLGSRSNLGTFDVTLTQQSANAFSAAQQYNVDGYRSFLANVNKVSPLAAGSSPQADAAAWSLLRYLADRRGTPDWSTWTPLVNSESASFANLREVFGLSIMDQIRDWATSVLVDDLFGSSSIYQQPSWNFRSIFQNAPGVPFPLRIVPVTPAAAVDDTVAALTASYFRFTVPANAQGSVTWSSGGATAISPLLRWTIVRTR